MSSTDRSAGHGALRVTGDSMRHLLEQGDIVLVSPCDAAELKRGDLIVFDRQDGSMVVHRLAHLSQRGAGRVAVEKGDNTIAYARIPVSAFRGRVCAMLIGDRCRAVTTDGAACGLLRQLHILAAMAEGQTDVFGITVPSILGPPGWTFRRRAVMWVLRRSSVAVRRYVASQTTRQGRSQSFWFLKPANAAAGGFEAWVSQKWKHWRIDNGQEGKRGT